MKLISLMFRIALLTCSVAAYSQGTQAPSADVTASTESDAERVARIEKVIASDKARLTALAADLTVRADHFARMSAEVAKREAKLAAMRAQLEAAVDVDETARIEKEIVAAEEKYELVKELSDLALQSEKAAREQILTLEQKIGIDQQALDEALGKVGMPESTDPAAGTTVPGQPTTQAPSQGGATPGVIPGMPAVPASPGAPPGALQKTVPETAEQIEARKQAATTAREAELAERAVLSFLERKAALQNQIDLEKSLLDTALQSKALADQALQIRQRELDEAKRSGSSKAAIAQAREKLDRIIVVLQELDQQIAQRENTLEGFSRRMQALYDEQAAVTQQAELKRKEAAAAQKQSVWLGSPLHPTNIARWGLTRGPNMLLVLIVVLVVLFVIRRSVHKVARATVGKGRRHRRDATTRADTLALSFGSAATMIIGIVGIFLIFEAAGVDIATILGGAAVLGVAIAFGAQNLMRDYFNGFIILIEDQYELNDLVTIGSITGRVESVSLRTTALRDMKGKLHFIPNGEIKSVTNRSYEWARIVFDIRVAYKENVDQVMAEILAVAREVCADPKYKDGVMDQPEMLGVDAFTEFGVHIKCLLKTSPNDLFPIKREILRRIKNRFDELGIEIPMANAAALPRV
jgi:moderate conductance mechanosensitive channel